MAALVGRRAELEVLGEAIARAEEGQVGVILLVGEPGVGKTRLAGEAAQLARERGFEVLEGRAHAADAELPYGPLVSGLAPWLRAVPPRRRAGLLRDLDDLGRLFVGLDLPQPVPLADPALERGRLFAAIGRLLARLAADHPVLLCIDDVHWADRTTLDVIDFLVRDLRDERVALLVTSREVEAESLPALVAMLRSLRRLDLLEELAVGRLDAAAVAELTRQALGGDPPAELEALVEARCKGVPLFVETMIGDLVESGGLAPTPLGWSLAPGAGREIPALVRDAILQRLERLSPPERRLVDVFALAGEAVAHSLLVEVLDMDPEALVMSLRRLRLAKLVAQERRDGDVVYVPTHPLIAEVAAAELSEIERQQIHRELAGALERSAPGEVDRLARHYRLAGVGLNPPRALQVLLAAGERARTMFAHAEAAANFDAALQRVGDGVGRGSLLERLGEARMRLSQVGAAVAAWQEALGLAEAAGDVLAVARMRRHLAEAEWTQGHMDEARRHLEAGIASVSSAPQGRDQLAHLYQSYAALLDRAGDLAGLESTVDALHSLATSHRSATVVVEALLSETGLAFQRGDFARSISLIEQGVEASRAAGDRLLELRAYDIAANLATEFGDHRSIKRFARAALDRARRVGSPSSEMRARGCLAVASLLLGDWVEADVELTTLVAFARRADIPRGWARATAMRGQLLVLRGELDQAASVLGEARAACVGLESDRHLMGTLVLAEGWLALERAEIEPRPALLTDLASPAGGLRPWRMATLAGLAVVRGDLGTAMSIADDLEDFNDGAGYFCAVAAWLRGTAHATAGQRESARGCLLEAAGGFDRLQLPWQAAQARLRWAEVCDEPKAAVGAARESLACFERVGARLWADRTRRILRRLGVTPAPPRRRASDGGALSRRELEVARLAAQGLTTAEIGGRLVISRHTAATHLQHIYERLGVHSRVALARRLGDAGLL